MKEKIGILGYGEVGKALAKFYKKPYIKDLERDNFPKFLDVLNVCIPYSNNFVKIVRDTIKKYNCQLVIIHSTVAVGTTERIGWRFCVHSPVRGVHPNLYEGLKTFTKYVGADFAGAGRLAAEHLTKIGMKPKVLYKSKTTELAKLLSTTYYGMCIAYHAYANKLCEREKVNFEQVMTEWNNSYNAGYMELGKPEVVRPILYPPVNDKIGKHCVIPNTEILKKQFGDDLILDTILRHKNYAKISRKKN